jgi:hypothetical protein
MRRFLVQMALFWLIQAAIFAAFFWARGRRSDSYLAASHDKEQRLATLAGPRVVFVGGSNLAFGLDSATIERCTGRRSVNMGLYVALGLPFMLDEVRAGLRPGDVVVLALEYFLFTSDAHLTGRLMDWGKLFRVNPLAVHHGKAVAGSLSGFREEVCKGLDQVFRGDGLGMIGEVVHSAFHPVRRDGDYARHNFNEAGDIAVFRERTPDRPPVPPEGACRNPAVTARAAALVGAFARECRQRGVAVFLAMPVFPRPDYDKHAAILDEIEAVLRRDVPVPILVTAREATLPPDCFHDSGYHLTTRAAVQRSELLGQRLAQALAQPEWTPDEGPAPRRYRRGPLLSIPGKP